MECYYNYTIPAISQDLTVSIWNTCALLIGITKVEITLCIRSTKRFDGN